MALDSEGFKDEMVVLADSLGNVIQNLKGIGLDEALEFLTRPELDGKTLVWFSSRYDINMIFKHASDDLIEQVFVKGVARYGKYSIKYIPGKFFQISRNDYKRKDLYYNNRPVVFVHYDVSGFFQSPFIKKKVEDSIKGGALDYWNISYSDALRRGKEARQDWAGWTIEEIIAYNNEECLKLVELMNKFAKSLWNVGIFLEAWLGSGAIARYLLKKWDLLDHFGTSNLISKETPKDDYRRTLYKYAIRAYFGGRIELLQRGMYENLYRYDINSAYPHAMLSLPSLKYADWIQKTGSTLKDIENFGIVHVKWKNKTPNDYIPRYGPFPFRVSKIGYVLFPNEGEGFYHTILVREAIAKGCWDIELLDGIFLRQPYHYFLKEKVETLSNKRLSFKARGMPEEIPLKLGLNSLYGKTVQSIGKNEFFNLIFAGYITAHCQSVILRAAPESPIMFSTDGIISNELLEVEIGEGLGQFEVKFVPNARFIMAGVYELKGKVKIRGFRTLTKEFLDANWDKISRGKKIVIEEYSFVGLRRARIQRKKFNLGGARWYLLNKSIDWNHNAKRNFLSNDISFPNDAFILAIPAKERVSAPYDKKLLAKLMEIDLREMPLDEFETHIGETMEGI